MKALGRQQASALFSQIIFWAIWLGLRGSSALSVFRAAVVIGPLFVLSIGGLVAWAVGGMAVFLLRIGLLRKRLLNWQKPRMRKSSWVRRC